MIGYERFAKLRLKQFLPAARLTRLRDWEYEDRTWVGEADGFSEWLRLADDAEHLRSLALDFTRFPPRAARRVLAALDLPLRDGMTVTELASVLGRPRKTLRFVPDRRSYEFMTGGKEPFRISCTVLAQGGLTYLGVMMPLGDVKRGRRGGNSMRLRG